ncbi:ribosomal protein S10 domain-containing protein [Cytidiella melzeri]|nr:ribosomal protein S10 domain-containing protein [Cytidiella melzeri]
MSANRAIDRGMNLPRVELDHGLHSIVLYLRLRLDSRIMFSQSRRGVVSAVRWARWNSDVATTTSSSAVTPRITMTRRGPAIDGVSEPELAAKVVHGRAVVEPYYHPRTHNIPAAVIHLRSHYPPLLDLFTLFLKHSASALAIPISRPTMLPTQRSLWTVPRSPFIHKKSQENFDRKTHKRAVKAWDTDPEVIERWVRYLQMHPVAGVGMRVVRWERAPVSVGKKIMHTVRAQLGEAETTKVQVEKLGKKIIEQELAAAKDIDMLQVERKKRV